MKTTGVIAFSLLSALAVAAPHQNHQQHHKEKRALVLVTETSEVIETVYETTTVYVDPTEDATSVAAQAVATSTVESSVEAQAYTPTSISIYVAPTTTAAPAYTEPSSTETPSSTYVEPSSTYVAPTTTETPTSTYVAPSSTYVASSTVEVSAAETSTSSSSDGSTVYTGSITYYSVGRGACGWTNTDDDPVVALASTNMGSESNGNSWCGKNITLSYNGKTANAYIADKCPGCDDWSLDLSPTLFSQLADQSEGKVSGVEWWVD